MVEIEGKNGAEIVGELERECPGCGGQSVLRDYQKNILLCEECGRIIRERIKDRGDPSGGHTIKKSMRRKAGPAFETAIGRREPYFSKSSDKK